MLVVTDSHTAIVRRLGLGQISKAAWIAEEPTLELICLG